MNVVLVYHRLHLNTTTIRPNFLLHKDIHLVFKKRPWWVNILMFAFFTILKWFIVLKLEHCYNLHVTSLMFPTFVWLLPYTFDVFFIERWDSSALRCQVIQTESQRERWHRYRQIASWTRCRLHSSHASGGLIFTYSTTKCLLSIDDR